MVAAAAVISVALLPSAATGFSPLIISSPATTSSVHRQHQWLLQQQQQHQHQRLQPFHDLRLHASANMAARPRKSTTTTSGNVVTMVKPKQAISAAKRKQALQAMRSSQNKVDNALSGVDAQVLEMLSEHFLYPTEKMAETMEAAVVKSRPKGRPEYVPGAMNYETMLRFREKKEFMDILEQRGRNKASRQHAESTMTPYTTTTTTNNGGGGDGNVEEKVSETSKPTSVKKGLKGASSKASSGISEVASAPKRRKRVVKSLPNPDSKFREKRLNGKKVSHSKRTKGSNLELHKYYRTELLDADEEYSLGMQVQFMVKCEQVHEGLATSLMRLPTIVEWAEACGFEEEDKTYIPQEGDEQIRPAGSENMFVETDPNMFVGTGLAHTAGPGRGRGRAKKPPPTFLKDFYDDSELRAHNKRVKENNGMKRMKRRDLEPINRGTVTDFVEMMMTAREAKQRMVQCNMRLVVSIARKYSNVGVNLQDLVQEGSLGLSRAAEKFQPAKGFKFSTYASW